jgi:hypothetical protein
LLHFYRKFYSPVSVAWLRSVIALRMAARTVKVLMVAPPGSRAHHIKACWAVLRL